MKKYLLMAGLCCVLSAMAGGCVQENKLTQAKNYSHLSDSYYQRAAEIYKGLIEKDPDDKVLRFGLGRLYYDHGAFREAALEFKKVNDAQSRQFLALAYYRLGDFTDALEIFNQEQPSQDEYRYYYGLTCEKLNLFDKALELYKEVKTVPFEGFARGRINAIEKQVRGILIKDLSPEVDTLLANAPPQKEYPQAGALILRCDERIEISPDNTLVSYLHYVVKILNERGKEDFSESHIEYDSTYEKVELEFARTIKPDGTVAQVGSRHIRDVSKYLNFPLYSNARMFIISFPEITEGASIEYSLKVSRSQLINKKDFIMSYPVQADEPVIDANFVIRAPKNKIMHLRAINQRYNSFGAPLAAQISQEGEYVLYRWHFKDIPQIIPESNMPPGVLINPTILLSTFKNWQDIYEWWWSLAKDKIKADASIKEKVQSLIKNKVTPEAKVRALYNFCAQKIRYVAVEYGQAGYEPHKAEDIFRNKYGDCKDQAILLTTMLKEAGFSAWPVLIPTKDSYNLIQDFPSLFFDHCIAAVSLGEEIVFLDPTAETCAFGDLPEGDQGRQVLICKEDGYVIWPTPLFGASHNRVTQDLKVTLRNDESMLAEKTILIQGAYDQAQRRWLLYTPPELIRQYLEEKIQGVSIGARLERYTVKNLEDPNTPVTLSYAFSGDEYLEPAGKLRIASQLAGLDASCVAKNTRTYPIDFGILDTRESLYEIELPSSLIVKYLPEETSEDNPWMKFHVTYEYKGRKVRFRQRMELKKSVISQEEYPQFKKDYESLARKIKQRLVLEKVK